MGKGWNKLFIPYGVYASVRDARLFVRQAIEEILEEEELPPGSALDVPEFWELEVVDSILAALLRKWGEDI